MTKTQTRTAQEIRDAISELKDRAVEIYSQPLFDGKTDRLEKLGTEKIELERAHAVEQERERLARIAELRELNVTTNARLATAMETVQATAEKAREAFRIANELEGARRAASDAVQQMRVDMAENERTIGELAAAETPVVEPDPFWIARHHADKLLAQIQFNPTHSDRRLAGVDVAGADEAIGGIAEMLLTSPIADYIKRQIFERASGRVVLTH